MPASIVPATPLTAPSGPAETFQIMNRYGHVIATAETLEIAKRDVLYRIGTLHQSGVYVERVTVHREVAYRPRLVTVAGS